MIASQTVIDSVLRPKMRRRMLRLPIAHEAQFAAALPCPLEVGQVVKLQPRPGASAQATITITELRREKLAALTLADARREGFASVQGALEAWTRQHGEPSEETRVWVVGFVRGNHASFMHQDDPIYLARNGDYTAQPARAVVGEPEVAIIPGAAEKARVLAIARRSGPQREAVEQLAAHIGSLQETLVDMKARNHLREAQRQLERAAARFPSDGPVDSDVLAAGA